ncbi:hypothetical protein CWI39_2235p0010 [Hamiltosporidium magnivora]|uniref:Transmembrane protein n=1 Tax=Hamiltosporidium magnivora TaxID=148818 RepID=A0A4Q9KVL1_9MICR|nr:hypothetical protein CWI39_2235p0010 [Hamiltosporidium magnivora]
MERLPSILQKQFPSILSAAIALSNTLNSALYLEHHGIVMEFPHTVVSTFFVFFLPPLIANTVYSQFMVTSILLMCFGFGILIFPYFKNLQFMFGITHIFSLVGRVLLLLDMKNSRKGTFTQMFMWLLIVDFVGMAVKKYFIRDRSRRIDEKEMFKLMCEVTVLYVFRKLRYSDSGMAACILVVNTWYPLKEVLCKIYDRRNKNEEEEIKNVEIKEKRGEKTKRGSKEKRGVSKRASEGEDSEGEKKGTKEKRGVSKRVSEGEDSEGEKKGRKKKGSSEEEKKGRRVSGGGTPVRKAALEAKLNSTSPRRRTPRKSAKKIEFEE